MKMNQILSVLLALLIAAPGFAQEAPTKAEPSTVSIFKAYLKNQATSKDVVSSLLENPKEYANKAKEIVDVIKAENLLAGDEVIANKVYRLQSDMNEAVVAYNKNVDSRRFWKGVKSAGAGLVVGWALSVAVDRNVSQSTTAYALGLFFIYLPAGALLGKTVSDGIDYWYYGSKLAPNDLLDKE